MKIDIDSIFYIILSIIILAVSGLGSRRRKQAQQQRPVGPAPPGLRTGEPEAFEGPQTRKPAMDPFERLEQILTGQSRYETLEGESLEVLEDEEQIIIDEKEKIQTPRSQDMELKKRDLTAVKEDKDVKKNLDGLFGDLNEITRAVIYSEIFPRKYI
jgi:hypothetical protein